MMLAGLRTARLPTRFRPLTRFAFTTNDAKIELSNEQKKKIKNAFKMFDLKGDGKICRKELELAMKNLGFEHKEEEVVDIFKKFDVTNRGALNYDEFEECLLREHTLTRNSNIDSDKFEKEEPLLYHSTPIPGKYTIKTTKPMNTQKDLSLAYSPGVAVPCIEIAKDREAAYKYTNKGNTVAVITNGTSVLGLGNIGALAGKPVMEGKAVLFNKFAGVESVDLCIETSNPDEFINCVKLLSCTFGGINLEDIKAPECFYIEDQLKKLCDIPIFHDDQHGTAIVALAGLINAMHLTNRKPEETKVVLNGAGAAGMACVRLFHQHGVKKENIITCDTKGVVYKGRTSGMNVWKEEFANDTTKARTLQEALVGADVFIGVSAGGALTADFLRSMNRAPIIFAMANPDPEIMPSEAHKIRPDAIVATGRSDFPNQINNVMCFPFLFRAALDTRTREINEPMKIAAAHALAMLAREPVPREVSRAYNGKKFEFGPGYIIPTPFDPRLLERIPRAVAQAAMDSGVARKEITDWEAYKYENKARTSHTYF